MAQPGFKLIVIRTGDVQRLVKFYRSLGMTFTEEQHGSGPRHFAAELGGVVFEIYPVKANQAADVATRLGFSVPDLQKTLMLLWLPGFKACQSQRSRRGAVGQLFVILMGGAWRSILAGAKVISANLCDGPAHAARARAELPIN